MSQPRVGHVSNKQVVNQQPNLMPAPAAIAGTPAGLEYLTMIDQLLVHQQIELWEVFSGWETCNRYQIKNTLGQQVYFAGEVLDFYQPIGGVPSHLTERRNPESGACMRQFCGPDRGFILHITDNLGREVIRASREFRCCAGWNCCADSCGCAMELQVEAPVGQVIGYVRQRQSCCDPKYAVLDAQGDVVLLIEGPACRCQAVCCTADIVFRVLSKEGTHQVGSVSRQWGGLVREMFTDADNFGVSFPMDLDVKVKALLLGATFLIDFMYFEYKTDHNN